MKSLNEQLDIAIILATKAHATQVDKKGDPYILHPLAVMGKLDYLPHKIAAVLHDVIEDTLETEDSLLEAGIEPRIVDWVVLLTHYSDDMTYREYLQDIREDDDAKLIKLADIEHNCDPSRLFYLPVEKQQYLLHKYTKAKLFLRGGAYASS